MNQYVFANLFLFVLRSTTGTSQFMPYITMELRRYQDITGFSIEPYLVCDDANIDGFKADAAPLVVAPWGNELGFIGLVLSSSWLVDNRLTLTLRILLIDNNRCNGYRYLNSIDE